MIVISPDPGFHTGRSNRTLSVELLRTSFPDPHQLGGGVSSMETSERTRLIMHTLLQMEKQFGKGSVLQLGSRNVLPVNVISTGSISLDAALGVGGVPRGRVIEVF